MKGVAATLIAFAVSLVWSCAALAHPGGTDDGGCHVERATGERHCHTSTPRPTAEDRATCADLPRCEGCGCRGGPGYRDLRTGKCVGHKDFERICGVPPTDRCRFENEENAGRNARCVLGEERAEELLERILPEDGSPRS